MPYISIILHFEGEKAFMKTELIKHHITAKKSPIHGYGIFADVNINIDEVIEECRIIILENHHVNLENYYFNVGGKSAIFTGFGLLYNHSDQPNTTYYFDEMNGIVIFKAIRPIKKGEEIFVSYGDNWFSCRDVPVKSTPFWYRLTHPSKSFYGRALIVATLLITLVQLIKSS